MRPSDFQTSNTADHRWLPDETLQFFVISLLIVAVVVAVYYPLFGYPFIKYDDPLYVSGNRAVQEGFGASGLLYAFKTLEGFWQPTTWIFLMTESTLFGVNPHAFHIVSVVLHAANALLLFSIARRLSHRLWPSALLALLFCCHPLTVESVAWIAEVKGLLASFFGLASILAYVRFIQNQRRLDLSAATIYYAIGMMSKPSIVMLPLIFTLIDYFWTDIGGGQPLGTDRGSASKPAPSWRVRLAEKLPMIAIGLAVTIADYFAEKQVGAVRTIAEVGLGTRIENAIHSLAIYISKAVLPQHLSVFYPYQMPIPLISLLASAGMLVLLIAAAIWLRKRFCWPLLGLAGFAILLLPSLGLLAIGEHSMADRYMYLPLMFLLAIPCASVSSSQLAGPAKSLLITASALSLVGSFAVDSRAYALEWRSDRSLFEHSLRVLPQGNFVAHIHVGLSNLESGRAHSAIAHLIEAENIAPNSPLVHQNLALAYQLTGQTESAEAEYQRAFAIAPNDPNILANYAYFLKRNSKSRPDRVQASLHLAARAVELNPRNSRFYDLLATLLFESGKTNEAKIIWQSAVARLSSKE